MLYKIFSFVCIIYCSNLIAESGSKDFYVPTSLANTAGIPSSIVSNVSTISGEFVDSQIDVSIPGPEPIILKRIYSSGDNSRQFFFHSWRFNQPSAINKIDNNFYQTEETGAVVKYTYPLSKSSTQASCQKGMTNCFSEEMSGKTNLKNHVIHTHKFEKLDVFSGVGGSNGFKHYNHRENLGFLNEFDEKINGNRKNYYFRSERHHGSIWEINATNKTGNIKYGYIQFDKPSEKLKDYFTWKFRTNYGNEITYLFEKGWRGYYLHQVLNPEKPTELFDYDDKANEHYQHIVKKRWLDGRFLKIEYYKMGSNENKGNTGLIDIANLNINKKEDVKLNRVKCLKAPMGKNNATIVTYRFYYNANCEVKKKNVTMLESNTEVFDAYDRKVTYHHSKDYLLLGIEKFSGKAPYKPYSFEGYSWGVKDTDDECNLMAKYLKDGTGNVIWANAYIYDNDKSGNIKEDRIYGNITGRGSLPISLNENDFPENNGCECYSKRFSYTPDKYKLLASEVYDNGKKTENTYRDNTDLIETQTLSANGVIHTRYTYEYDSFNTLIKKISECPHPNKEGKKVKLITTIIPTAPSTNGSPKEYPIGLPQVICEWYEDSETNQLKLLSKLVNHYTREGWLKEQEYHDSNDRLQYSLTWKYDAHGNCIYETNAKGEVIERRYNLKNDCLIYEKKEGLETTYDYYLSGLVKKKIQIYQGKLLETLYEYDYCGNQIKTTDHFGNTTEYTYDEFGSVIEEKGPLTVDEYGQISRAIIKRSYDVMGNAITVTDANNHTTTTSYNIYNKPLSIRYPDSTQEEFEYRLDGTLAKKKARNDLVTLYEHDAFGRLLSREDFTSNYESMGKEIYIYQGPYLVSHTDPKGYTTFYSYDDAGRQVAITKNEKQTIIEFDDLGRIAKKKELYGFSEREIKTTLFKYDLLNRLIHKSILDFDGRILSQIDFEYDERGNCRKVTKQNHQGPSITSKEFDEFKRPRKITNALGHEITFEYIYGPHTLEVIETDSLKNSLTTRMDPLNRVASLIRKNAKGLITSKTQFFYDLCGNQRKRIDTVITPDIPDREIVTSWKHTETNELALLIEAEGSSLQKETKTDYIHSKQQKWVTKPNGVRLLYQYDHKGRLIEFASSNKSFHYAYEYDLNDNLLSVKDRIGKTETTRVFNSYNHLIQETLGNGLTILYDYDLLDRVTCITLPDNTTIGYGYDPLFLRSIFRAVDGKKIYTHEYKDYDLSGNLKESQLFLAAGTVRYEYDLLHRLRKIEHSEWSEIIQENGYDSVGNLTSYTVEDAFGTIQSYFTYDDLYQMTSEKGVTNHSYNNDSLNNRVSKDGAAYLVNDLNQITDETDKKYSYDKNGNLIQQSYQKETKKVIYSYDDLDRLISVVDGSKKYEYLYDSFNRRLTKTCLDSDGEGWKKIWLHHYIYENQNEIGMTDENLRIFELRILGVGKGAEIGATVGIELRRKLFVPLHDHNGNIVCLVDSANGEGVQTYRYSAFGENDVFDTPENMRFGLAKTNPWKFSSKRQDPETKFLYFGRRYYSPIIGRWITADPDGYEDGPNLYAYVHNSPLTHFDLYGLFCIVLDTRPSFGASKFDTYSNSYSPKKDQSQPIASIQMLNDQERKKNFEQFLAYQGPSLCTVPTPSAGLRSLTVNVLRGLRTAYNFREVFSTIQKRMQSSGNQTFRANDVLHEMGGISENVGKIKELGSRNFTKDFQWKFPNDSKNFLKDLPRDTKGRIYPSDNIRIRPERHLLKNGDTYNARHHGQHYHVETRRNPNLSWRSNENIEIIKPPDYSPGSGTGFLPGEFFPGL